MHNVKKKHLSAEQAAAKRLENVQRAASYSALSRAAFARRAAGLWDAASLEAAARVLEVNPDMAPIWNFRRECLQSLHGASVPPDAAAEPAGAVRAACEAELALTQACLGANPKSYPVWYHRTWVLTWGGCGWAYARELKLTTKLLSLDERNFHCWTHRRFVVQLSKVTAEAELRFTTQKVEANFSNYSAWHYRSKLLPAMHAAADPAATAAASGALRAALLAELELLRNAFFTAPEDQSAWFYHRWVLSRLRPTGGGLLRGEAEVLRELRDVEPDAKWPLAALAHALALLGEAGAATEAEAAEREAALTSLCGIDPARRRYYEASLAGGASAEPEEAA
ncbi:hypothetical protein EMIHUDRAFT_226711 [Emiliania huxleyi CCMP1516]|uniref:Geranylgeranyl transferase type-2 subunit alpha n=2 Tax=Emiliania huxleyi TaxID=2903 RepID=A0A0D3KK58_EMIH1|nr:hypothetical protein EMIHUDRAFT_226711 [Emiliania huxleyi CCMP1516]EOD36143.1 hypothetical protein EMIHUDRAFT_226711 [Emiliania huxleyi CCMP1516]|eukprot:XP_005788572.1 hypothetical protein EMIHUDRAFT_226711 [Emiliania huxleyi CCMP1516]